MRPVTTAPAAIDRCDDGEGGEQQARRAVHPADALDAAEEQDDRLRAGPPGRTSAAARSRARTRNSVITEACSIRCPTRETDDVCPHRLTTTRHRCSRIWSTRPPIMNGIRTM